MTICIIPARSGSKRIPKKNIKKFHGKEMIRYAIEVAKKTNLFRHIFVSTDDQEIAKISKNFGAEVPFLRPHVISDDYATTVDVMHHAEQECNKIGIKYNYMCCLYPCVPFLLAKDIIDGLDILKNGNSSYTFPVAKFSSPIQRAFKIDKNMKLNPFFKKYSEVRTQDLESAYYDAGQFYWGHKKSWNEKINIHYNGTGIIIPKERAVDIDTKDDWSEAEILYGKLNKEKK